MILETERLRLREFTLDDAEALEAVLGDPVAMQYYPAPFVRAEIDDWIRRNRAILRPRFWFMRNVAEGFR